MYGGGSLGTVKQPTYGRVGHTDMSLPWYDLSVILLSVGVKFFTLIEYRCCQSLIRRVFGDLLSQCVLKINMVHTLQCF